MLDQLAKLKKETFQAFIRANETSDLTKLLFAGNKPDVEIKLAVDQILSRRKAKQKLPSWYKKENVLYPPPLSLEQASSDPAAKYKSKIMSGAHLVDLTGGMGVDLLRMSKKFEAATYVEQDEWLCALFGQNKQLFKGDSITVFHQSAEEFLKKFNGKASFFIDPARRDVLNQKVYLFTDCTPDITKILFQLKEKADQVLVKASPMIDLTEGKRELKYVKHIHVLSIQNECKEVLFHLDFQKNQVEPDITCCNFQSDKEELFTFNLVQEKGIAVAFGSVGRYLYDPNSSILKAGAFKSITAKYNLLKLGPNTHLYTGQEMIEDFPGRKFIVIKDDVNKQDIAELLADKQANVFTKDYPIKADELRRKYKLEEGSSYYLIGYRDLNGKPKMVLANKLT